MCALDAISNNKIKEIVKLHQKKYRDESGLFIAEGFKALEELINNNIEIVDIYVKSDICSKLNIKQKFNIINESAMKKISTTSSPCEVLTIAKQKKYKINEIADKKHIVLLDSISDPGNLGTIIRSAAAFNIDAIILYGDCVELYSPKVIRSTAGNMFKIPICTIKDKKDIIKHFNNHKKIVTSLSDKNNISLKDCAKIDKYIILMGSEANGLQTDLLKLSDWNIRLDMTKNVESLNLSISTSIILYELFINT